MLNIRHSYDCKIALAAVTTWTVHKPPPPPVIAKGHKPTPAQTKAINAAKNYPAKPARPLVLPGAGGRVTDFPGSLSNPAPAADPVPLPKGRRRTELLMLAFALAVVAFADAAVGLGLNGHVPASLVGYVGGFALIMLGAHFCVRWLAPWADPLHAAAGRAAERARRGHDLPAPGVRPQRQPGQRDQHADQPARPRPAGVDARSAWSASSRSCS